MKWGHQAGIPRRFFPAAPWEFQRNGFRSPCLCDELKRDETQSALGESPVGSLSDRGSTPLISTKNTRPHFQWWAGVFLYFFNYDSLKDAM